ncbi:DUF3883 domain-containing protein [Mesorhizobium sp. M1233]|uniref:protein NO VEIN domain-containing protein n=1 Tax=Mesorhizobium sp. M1233 TaxID=2957072 RepID=UPI00333BEC76
MPVLICHVVWMPRYAGEDDVHAGGFDYVQDEGYGHELLNFQTLEGNCYGYVQTRTGVIKISRLGADKDDTFVDGVTIIWTAPHPNGGRVVVGWYRNARVYKRRQRGQLKGRYKDGRRVGYLVQASAEDCFLVPERDRGFVVPHKGPGQPGQASVFYPEESSNDEMLLWLKRAKGHLSRSKLPPVSSEGRELETSDKAPKASGGWPTAPDAAHNAAVEAAAIAFVRNHFGRLKKDRQKDNCGWDLEFTQGGRTLCVEVKGLSGSEIGVELTPNEYGALNRAMMKTFGEGDYRLAVVCNALTTKRKLFLFAHHGQCEWVCELTSRRISAFERVAARLA